MKESLLLAMLGGVAGIGIAFGLTHLIGLAPMVGDFFSPVWEWDLFVRALFIALILGLLGGVYPAFRATRLQPAEALGYE